VAGHGGSTWNSSVNRVQVTDGARILGDIVPIIIHLMMENPRGGPHGHNPDNRRIMP